MMKYIAFGMIAALLIDATVIRMLLVPAVMSLLKEDCWWAPRWITRLSEKVGHNERLATASGSAPATDGTPAGDVPDADPGEAASGAIPFSALKERLDAEQHRDGCHR
jgi:RND superfamily putative drug exporter